jgi:hypothetical protein
MSIHTCSYYCDRPECVKAQRDELRQKFEQAESLDKQDEIKALIEDLRLNHEFCPKEVILQAADELERMQQGIETLHALYEQAVKQRDYWPGPLKPN